MKLQIDRRMATIGILGLIGLVGAAVAGPGMVWASAIVASAALLAVGWRTGGLALTTFGMFFYFAAAQAANVQTDSTITAAAYGALTAAYLAHLARSRRRLAQALPVLILVAFFASWMVASVLFLAEPGGAAARKMSLAPFFMAAPFAAGLLLRREDLAELLRLVVVLAVLLAAAAVAHVAVTGLVGQGRLSVFTGWNPISHAMTLVAGALVLVPALGAARGRLRFLLLAAAAGLSLVAVLAGSRGPLVGMAVALGAHFLLAHGYRRSTRVLVAGAALAIVFGAEVLLPEDLAVRYQPSSIQRVEYEVNSVALRSTMYADAWRLFSGHPVMGVGVGNFAIYSTDRYEYPHNLVLEVAAEMGIGGLVLFLPLILIAAWRAIQLLRTCAVDPRDRWLDQALGLVTLLVIVEANISGDLQGSAPWWLFLGAVAQARRVT